MRQVSIKIGDARDRLRELPDASVHCVVTSPPYWGLRDYGTAKWEGGDPECDHVEHRGSTRGGSASTITGGIDTTAHLSQFRATCGKCGARRIDSQLGLEPTPEEYVANMVAVFREVRRVLRDDGTVWLNLGDSYYNTNPGSGGKCVLPGAGRAMTEGRYHSARRDFSQSNLKPKDLVGIPWRVAFALQADGWVLRQEIVWAKPNPMPESVRDRCTKSHEQIFLFAKARWSGPDNGQFAKISDEDARWLALCIDTEGSIVVKRSKHEGRGDTFAPQVAFGSTSLELMERFAAIVGHGNLARRPGQNADMHYWQVANGIARDFLLRIYPYLIVKQRQARIGIYVDSLTYYRGGKLPERKQRLAAELAVLDSLWARNKELNHFGNPDLSDVPEPQFGRWADCERYYFDAEAIAEPFADDRQGNPGAYNWKQGSGGVAGGGPNSLHKGDGRVDGWNIDGAASGRNKRSVWTITTQPFPEAHFATFPPALVEPCIKAGCPEGGTVLDPFGGSGTTGLVADRLGRNAILIELNPEYAAMAERRINGDAGLFASASITPPETTEAA